MTPDKYECADVDGTFCIKHLTTDYNDPNIVVHYWPTALRTVDVLHHFFDCRDKNLVRDLTAAETFPGEYLVKARDGQGRYIGLVNGGRTRPIKTDVVPARVPKVRNGISCYWSGGVWVKHLKSGIVNIDPLTV